MGAGKESMTTVIVRYIARLRIDILTIRKSSLTGVHMEFSLVPKPSLFFRLSTNMSSNGELLALTNSSSTAGDSPLICYQNARQLLTSSPCLEV